MVDKMTSTSTTFRHHHNNSMMSWRRRSYNCHHFWMLLCVLFLHSSFVTSAFTSSFVSLSSSSSSSSFSPCRSSSCTTTSDAFTASTTTTTRTTLLHMIKKPLSPREEEIQRKILQLKRQGRKSGSSGSGTTSDDGSNEKSSLGKTDYTKQLQDKLGRKRSQFYLGIQDNDNSNDEPEYDDELEDDDDYEEDDDDILAISNNLSPPSVAKLGTLGTTSTNEETVIPLLSKPTTTATTELSSTSTTTATTSRRFINPDLFGKDDEDDEATEMSEEDLVELVAKKLQEKRRREAELLQQPQQPQQQTQPAVAAAATAVVGSTSTTSSSSSSTSTRPDYYITSGVGGNWNKNESSNAQEDLYMPSSSGSWGAFPRPRDISKAYGGGRQVTPSSGSSGISGSTTISTEDATRERLRQYRERVGIEVQSEKDHATEIDEALNIASYAMQRGVYATAVSALEKVTKYCSTNSKVGGKVFLELAMAYEAVGRSGEAMTVYRTLSTCRIEDIKFNAKRLLYGMEAMQFMRDEAKSAEFSRKKIRNTFIDTTGLANIAQQFDDVYQTAYIDLNSNFYRRLTEAVVRSNREARQILLKATGSGEVDRLKVVQALRSLSRNFESALEKELRVTLPQPEPVALMNGQPIRPDRRIAGDDSNNNDNDLNNVMSSMDEFVLASAEQMMENLQGEWRLQLIADRRGDGVKYYNTSLSWQRVDTNTMTFQSCGGNVGFITMSQSGEIEFDKTRRVLQRHHIRTSGGSGGGGGGGGGMLLWGSLFFAPSGGSGGVTGAICAPQQIMSVDSILLVTQCAAPDATGSSSSSSSTRKDNADKDHFAVWRRVQTGTYSKDA